MEDKIKERIKLFSQSLEEPEFMLKKRLEAYDKVKINSGTVFRHGLNISTHFETDWTNLNLFQPGSFETSAPGLVLKKKEILSEFYESLDEQNRLVNANLAFLNCLTIIRIPKNEDVGNLSLKGKSSGDLFSYVLIIAEEGSKATIFNDISDQGSYKSCMVQIFAHPNSKIKFCSVQRLKECQNYFWKKAVIEKDAEVEWLDVSVGGTISRNETYSELKGQGSKTKMFNVFFGFGNQQFDFFNKCTHLGRNSESFMMSSGALQDGSKAINHAFAKITEKAYGGVTHQKAKILLLSEKAKASPIPKLEIDNNDVSASHEASVGQIDRENFFYLMSRGLNEKEAKKVYVEGFFEQYLSQIDVQEIKEDVEKIVSERMSS